MRERRSASLPIHTPDAPIVPGVGQGNIIPITRRLVRVETMGMVAFDPNKTELALVEGGIVEQTQQTLTNVGTILAAGGARIGEATGMTVWLADFARDFPEFNRVYNEWKWVKNTPPTRATVGAQLFPGVLVEIKGEAYYHPTFREGNALKRKLRGK